MKEFEFIKIDSVEKIEDYNDEYVYDIEVDNCHTFFANDILVHNSLYIELAGICKQLGISDNNSADFITKLWKYGLGPYMDECYEKYAKYWNCNKNLEQLELEKISQTVIMLAKKHYAMEASWEEPGIFLQPLEDIIYKGIELNQRSTPKYAKECQEDFYKFVFDYYRAHNTKPNYTDILDKLTSYKEKFILQDPRDISKGSTIGDYEKFILEDKNQLTIGLHCPIHVKGAGIANYLLNKNAKYKSKYNFLKTGDKVKFYYTTDPRYEVFSFESGKFPIEYAPKIDYDKTFEKNILDPLNRVIIALGYSEANSNLCYSNALF